MATKSSNDYSPPSLFSSPLTIKQLIDVVDLLERCGFPQRRWKKLGLTLGLLINSLEAIAENYSKVEDRFIECIARWLRRADNVDNKGGATFDSLSDALKSMNENAAADKLDQESKLISLIVLVLTVYVYSIERNAMISGNDIKGTNDVHSTATAPGQLVQPSHQSHTEPDSSPTVIQLSSKEVVARNIELLHQQFIRLVTEIRKHFNKLVSNKKLEADEVAFHAETYLEQDLKLSEINMQSIFTAIRPHYDFLNFGLLKSLVRHFITLSDDIHTKLIQYIDSVDKFSELSQLKHIRSTIKEKLSSSPAVASPTISNQTKPVVIKLNGIWDEMTLTKFKRVLEYYFGHKVADISTIVDIHIGSVVITLLIPTSLSQSLIDAINNKTNSMSRLGILEVSVDNKVIPIKRNDDNNFDISLHESVKAGDSFEVSMLLQLGADPNSKDERGKSAVEIANEGGHTQIKEILLTGGGELFDTNIITHT
uniref:Death domain-containing protein n=1 Tax=Amphimedon queenslandica TaxID=400682 RepID=A0A1X7TGU9_AMPQE